MPKFTQYMIGSAFHLAIARGGYEAMRSYLGGLEYAELPRWDELDAAMQSQVLETAQGIRDGSLTREAIVHLILSAEGAEELPKEIRQHVVLSGMLFAHFVSTLRIVANENGAPSPIAN